MHTCSVSVKFISGESETKPIKPINHEQPTNWRLSISTQDCPPLECSVRSDELPMSMQMRMCVVM
jgi:hypothetical protein